MAKRDMNKQQLYTDDYFEQGHFWLKVRQTIVAIFGWLCVFIPMIITAMNYYDVGIGKFKLIWHFTEGIFEIHFLSIVLLFLASAALIYTVAMTIIQVRKRERLVEQWPTFNPITQKNRETALEKFMDKRFGPASDRENARNYRVKPEQNLDTDEFQRLFEAQRKERS